MAQKVFEMAPSVSESFYRESFYRPDRQNQKLPEVYFHLQRLCLRCISISTAELKSLPVASSKSLSVKNSKEEAPLKTGLYNRIFHKKALGLSNQWLTTEETVTLFSTDLSSFNVAHSDGTVMHSVT